MAKKKQINKIKTDMVNKTFHEVKQNIISSEYKNSDELFNFPALELPRFLLTPTMSNHMFVIKSKRDELQYDNIKSSHRLGITVPVNWQPIENQYESGIINEGSKECIMRFSIPTLARKSIDGDQYGPTLRSLVKKTNISIAMKIWKENKSTDLVFLSKSGKSTYVHNGDNSGVIFLSGNPFEDRQSTDVTISPVVRTAFEMLSSTPGKIRLDALVEEGESPKLIDLVPTDAILGCYDQTIDFRLAIKKQLDSLEDGTVLYHVHDESNICIAKIVINGNAVCSRYGDHQLHFHHNMDYDRNHMTITDELLSRMQRYNMFTSKDDLSLWLYTFYFEPPGLRFFLYPSTVWTMLQRVFFVICSITIENGWLIMLPFIIVIFMIGVFFDLCGVLPGIFVPYMVPFPQAYVLINNPSMATLQSKLVSESVQGVKWNSDLFQTKSMTASPIIIAALGLLSTISESTQSQVIQIATGAEFNQAVAQDLHRLGTFSKFWGNILKNVIFICLVFNYHLARTMGNLVRFFPLQNFLIGYKVFTKDRTCTYHDTSMQHSILRDTNGGLRCPYG